MRWHRIGPETPFSTKNLCSKEFHAEFLISLGTKPELLFNAASLLWFFFFAPAFKSCELHGGIDLFF
jgi:hypothetical protein